MSKINWNKTLGWTEEDLDDIRFAAYSYIRQGKYDIAISFFDALIILEPDNAYNFQTLGALHLQMGNAAKALKYLDRALKLDADHTPTLLNLTKAFFMLGKRDEGLKLANILKDEPDPSVANIAKALILAYK